MIYLWLIGAVLVVVALMNKAATDNPTVIELMADAIQRFEGWAPGTRSYRNNNPGNLKYTAWTKEQGATGQDTGGFAVFPDYETGRNALLSLLLLRARQHPDWTILDLFDSYAPASDGNPTVRYAETVAKAVGVTMDAQLGELV